jgi:hypothetical protein
MLLLLLPVTLSHNSCSSVVLLLIPSVHLVTDRAKYYPDRPVLILVYCS